MIFFSVRPCLTLLCSFSPQPWCLPPPRLPLCSELDLCSDRNLKCTLPLQTPWLSPPPPALSFYIHPLLPYPSSPFSSLSSPDSPCPTQLLSPSCWCLWNAAFKNAAFWINESFLARCSWAWREGLGWWWWWWWGGAAGEAGEGGGQREKSGEEAADKYRGESVTVASPFSSQLPDAPPPFPTTHTHSHSPPLVFPPHHPLLPQL